MEEASGNVFRKSGRGDLLRTRAIRRASDADHRLRLSQFKILKETGRHGMGTQYLAQLRGTQIYYSMKVMDKHQLASQGKLKSAQNEKEILQMLDHPFVQPLYCYFETETSFYAVTDYCPGGINLCTLRELYPGNYFPEDTARFYAAEVLIALEYLHQLEGIVYRDLKPENVFIRSDGHIMLMDFSSSVMCTLDPYLVTDCTPCSSNYSGVQKLFRCLPFLPAKICNRLCRRKSAVDCRRKSVREFVAEPRSEGDNLIGSAMDLWTFGVFLYELLFGQMPFKIGHGECRYYYYNAVRETLRFPRIPSVSEEAMDLIKALLEPSSKEMLEMKNVKRHPFFRTISWNRILSITPPFVPPE
ncbi:hypothetical protein SUGI_0915750 [Cryptomeria japonica]|uniref:serine/threonine-protein kinase AGC1-7-like n=1 Tax=Cryptomeria japonica TaxID=3369 RepID=UPI0024147C4C|nr:serine/threonine-protein kinase AGC1-7-like [Cryptomeria japonica]GLJ43929.1 hypothetical protein SUGI_0915750 [Cryptomeria japonica]